LGSLTDCINTLIVEHQIELPSGAIYADPVEKEPADTNYKQEQS
jgi:hypothetical protein